MSHAILPNWKSTFPVRQSEEHLVSRRQFVKIAGCSAIAVGGGSLAKDKLFPFPKSTEPKRVGRVDDLPVGGSLLFNYPSELHPAILVRLREHEYVAYSQSCTHLMCPINYQHDKRQFYCPCHEGYFSAEDGRVLAGPPPRTLPSFPVELREDEIWVNPSE